MSYDRYSIYNSELSESDCSDSSCSSNDTVKTDKKGTRCSRYKKKTPKNKKKWPKSLKSISGSDPLDGYGGGQSRLLLDTKNDWLNVSKEEDEDEIIPMSMNKPHAEFKDGDPYQTLDPLEGKEMFDTITNCLGETRACYQEKLEPEYIIGRNKPLIEKGSNRNLTRLQGYDIHAPRRIKKEKMDMDFAIPEKSSKEISEQVRQRWLHQSQGLIGPDYTSLPFQPMQEGAPIPAQVSKQLAYEMIKKQMRPTVKLNEETWQMPSINKSQWESNPIVQETKKTMLIQSLGSTQAKKASDYEARDEDFIPDRDNFERYGPTSTFSDRSQKDGISNKNTNFNSNYQVGGSLEPEKSFSSSYYDSKQTIRGDSHPQVSPFYNPQIQNSGLVTTSLQEREFGNRGNHSSVPVQGPNPYSSENLNGVNFFPEQGQRKEVNKTNYSYGNYPQESQEYQRGYIQSNAPSRIQQDKSSYSIPQDYQQQNQQNYSIQNTFSDREKPQNYPIPNYSLTSQQNPYDHSNANSFQGQITDRKPSQNLTDGPSSQSNWSSGNQYQSSAPITSFYGDSKNTSDASKQDQSNLNRGNNYQSNGTLTSFQDQSNKTDSLKSDLNNLNRGNDYQSSGTTTFVTDSIRSRDNSKQDQSTWIPYNNSNTQSVVLSQQISSNKDAWKQNQGNEIHGNNNANANGGYSIQEASRESYINNRENPSNPWYGQNTSLQSSAPITSVQQLRQDNSRKNSLSSESQWKDSFPSQVSHDFSISNPGNSDALKIKTPNQTYQEGGNYSIDNSATISDSRNKDENKIQHHTSRPNTPMVGNSIQNFSSEKMNQKMDRTAMAPSFMTSKSSDPLQGAPSFEIGSISVRDRSKDSSKTNATPSTLAPISTGNHLVTDISERHERNSENRNLIHSRQQDIAPSSGVFQSNVKIEENISRDGKILPVNPLQENSTRNIQSDIRLNQTQRDYNSRQPIQNFGNPSNSTATINGFTELTRDTERKIFDPNGKTSTQTNGYSIIAEPVRDPSYSREKAQSNSSQSNGYDFGQSSYSMENRHQSELNNQKGSNQILNYNQQQPQQLYSSWNPSSSNQIEQNREEKITQNQSQNITFQTGYSIPIAVQQSTYNRESKLQNQPFDNQTINTGYVISSIPQQSNYDTSSKINQLNDRNYQNEIANTGYVISSIPQQSNYDTSSKVNQLNDRNYQNEITNTGYGIVSIPQQSNYDTSSKVNQLKPLHETQSSGSISSSYAQKAQPESMVYASEFNQRGINNSSYSIAPQESFDRNQNRENKWNQSNATVTPYNQNSGNFISSITSDSLSYDTGNKVQNQSGYHYGLNQNTFSTNTPASSRSIEGNNNRGSSAIPQVSTGNNFNNLVAFSDAPSRELSRDSNTSTFSTFYSQENPATGYSVQSKVAERDSGKERSNYNILPFSSQQNQNKNAAPSSFYEKNANSGLKDNRNYLQNSTNQSSSQQQQPMGSYSDRKENIDDFYAFYQMSNSNPNQQQQPMSSYSDRNPTIENYYSSMPAVQKVNNSDRGHMSSTIEREFSSSGVGNYNTIPTRHAESNGAMESDYSQRQPQDLSIPFSFVNPISGVDIDPRGKMISAPERQPGGKKQEVNSTPTISNPRGREFENPNFQRIHNSMSNHHVKKINSHPNNNNRSILMDLATKMPNPRFPDARKTRIVTPGLRDMYPSLSKNSKAWGTSLLSRGEDVNNPTRQYHFNKKLVKN